MSVLNPTSAFLGTTYVGTNRLGRPLTAAEQRELASFLRRHDFAGASVVSLHFAFKLTRAMPAAQDLQERANQRLVEQGWDPGAVSLVKCLCQFVSSERKHEGRRRTTAQKAEKGFLREEDPAAPAFEDEVVQLEDERDEEKRAVARTAKLREAFVKAGDTVNQIWLDHWCEGVEAPAEIARRSGLDVKEFYHAADRRKRHVAKLLASENGAKGEKKEEKK
ncbi:MAG: hypothetical protein JOZ69_19820 [Myxococcales bacterium]|nr:hypothetical protein [Myxococcales bacterium]